MLSKIKCFYFEGILWSQIWSKHHEIWVVIWVWSWLCAWSEFPNFCMKEVPQTNPNTRQGCHGPLAPPYTDFGQLDLWCSGTPVSRTNSILKRNYLFLGWLSSRLHDLVGYRASEDWKTKSIGSLMLPIQIITSWFKYCPCKTRQEELFAAFLSWIKLRSMLL